MSKRISVIIVLIAALLAGCLNRESASVKGKIQEPPAAYLKLWKNDVDMLRLIDSVKIGKNGSFRFKFPAAEPEFYQLGFSSSDFVTLLVQQGDKIGLWFAGPQLHTDYTVEGSDESENIRQLEMKLASTRNRIDSLNKVYLSTVEDLSQRSVSAETEKLIYDAVMEQRMYNIDYIINHLGSMSSIKALYQQLNNETYVLYDSRDLQIMKLLSDTLSVKYPNSKQVKALTEDFNRELSNMQMSRIAQMAESVEPMVLDPSLVNIEGKRITLSSLRGKYVLVAFWSAKSRECIANNLLLKDYYKLYRRKGFEIYQISIDDDEQAWRDAVKFDELPWISVREDDPANLKYAYIYNVQSLPANYLYDPDGEIIATNLFGRNLAIKLEQLFGL